MKVTSLSGFKKTWLTTGLPPLALLAGQHASPCFVNHKTSDNSALIISTLFTGLLIWTAQLKAVNAVDDQQAKTTLKPSWESELSHSGMRTAVGIPHGQVGMKGGCGL